jgi:hypothetical protein
MIDPNLRLLSFTLRDIRFPKKNRPARTEAGGRLHLRGPSGFYNQKNL